MNINKQTTINFDKQEKEILNNSSKLIASIGDAMIQNETKKVFINGKQFTNIDIFELAILIGGIGHDKAKINL